MLIYCDLFTPLGDSIGDGPITSIIYARITDRLDLDGEFYFEMPAAHPLAQYVTAKRVARLYQRTDVGRVDLGNGEIESVESIIRQDQPPLLAVRGSGQLRELALAVIPQGTAYTDSNSIPLDIVSDYANDQYLIDGWVLTAGGGGKVTTGRELSTTFTGTNVLEALISVAEATGEHFRRGTRDREVVWVGGALDLVESGITATTQPYGVNPLLCRILDIRQTLDGYEIFNRIHPYGGGTDADNQIDISNADTWPDGEAITSDPETHNLGGSSWTIDKSLNLLTNDASIATYGQRAKALTLTNIPAEEGATDAAISNMVLQSAYNWARTRGDVAEYYEIKIADCAQILLPGQTIRVIAKWPRDGRMPIDIDADLYILEVVNETTALGVVTAQIFASTVDRWNETPEDMLLDAVVGTSVSAASIVGVGHSHSQYVPAGSVPASASAAGVAGQFAYDSSYIYVCVATDTWERAALATW